MESTLHGKGIVLSECPTCHKPVAHKELLDNHLIQNLVQIVRPWLSNKSGATRESKLHPRDCIASSPFKLIAFAPKTCCIMTCM